MIVWLEKVVGIWTISELKKCFGELQREVDIFTTNC